MRDFNVLAEAAGSATALFHLVLLQLMRLQPPTDHVSCIPHNTMQVCDLVPLMVASAMELRKKSFSTNFSVLWHVGGSANKARSAG